MRLIAKKAFPYSGRRLAVGDSFEAGARHARVLMAIGHAAAPDAEPEIVEPEPEPEPTSAPRRYRRRDMQAET